MKKTFKWEKWTNSIVVGPLAPDEDGNINVDESVKIIPVIPLGNGLVPVQDKESKEIVMWTCHTNFNVTGTHKIMIGRVPGVEHIEILSRYQFRIKVAELFVDKDVRENIELLIGNTDVYDKEIVSRILANKKKILSLDLDTRNKYGESIQEARMKKPYGIAIFPNGYIEISHSQKSILDLVQACDNCGGWTEASV